MDQKMFKYDEEQTDKYNTWNEKHVKTCPLMQDPLGGGCGAIGGRLTFTPTGLGEIAKIKCACGKELDVSYYDRW